MSHLSRRLFLASAALTLAACAKRPPQTPKPQARRSDQLYPNETPQMRALINTYAAKHEIPASLIHRVIQRESNYRADARNGPYFGLMQILPQTARQMGHRGPPDSLLDAETNLKYAGRYLRGAWLVSNGDEAAAVGWFSRGYYYEARDRCMLVETRLRSTEVRRDCR